MFKAEKTILKQIKVFDSIEYGVDEETGNIDIVFINGKYNPDLAWSLRRRAQGKIFSAMRKSGLPLTDGSSMGFL